MDYVKEVAGKWDEVVESFGVKVFIDPRALLHIVGSTMDFVDDHVSSSLPLAPRIVSFLSHASFPRCGLNLCSTIPTAKENAGAANRSMCDAPCAFVSLAE
jgi:hypothetical protein